MGRKSKRRAPEEPEEETEEDRNKMAMLQKRKQLLNLVKFQHAGKLAWYHSEVAFPHLPYQIYETRD